MEVGEERRNLGRGVSEMGEPHRVGCCGRGRQLGRGRLPSTPRSSFETRSYQSITTFSYYRQMFQKILRNLLCFNKVFIQWLVWKTYPVLGRC